MTTAMLRPSLSIKQKLRLIIMVTVGAALMLACTAVLGYDYVTFRENSTAALSFGDQNATEEILSGLKAEPGIVAACIYSSDAKPFAIYRRERERKEFVPPLLHSDGSWFEGGRLISFKRITLRHQTIGAIYLESDLVEIQARLKRFAGIVLVILLLLESCWSFCLSLRCSLSDCLHGFNASSRGRLRKLPRRPGSSPRSRTTPLEW